MAALPRPVHVLAERALVALHDVPAALAHGPPGQPAASASRRAVRGRRRQRQRVQGDARQRRLAGRAQQVHVVTVRDERGDEAGGRALHAAVEDERARDDEDLHRGRAASARSTSGKQRGARGGEAVARLAALARAPPELGGAGRIVEEPPQRRRPGPPRRRAAPATPQPSRISGIIETAVETIGRPSAIASKILAGTWPTRVAGGPLRNRHHVGGDQVARARRRRGSRRPAGPRDAPPSAGPRRSPASAPTSTSRASPPIAPTASTRSSTPLWPRGVPRNITTRSPPRPSARARRRAVVAGGIPGLGVAHVGDERAAEAALAGSARPR